MKLKNLKHGPIWLFIIGLGVLIFSSDGGRLFAHDDAAPHQNHPPLHAIDVMRAFEDDHHEVHNLAAATVNTCSGGFAVPLDNWMRGDLREWAEDLLTEDSLSKHGLLNIQLVRKKWYEQATWQVNTYSELLLMIKKVRN